MSRERHNMAVQAHLYSKNQMGSLPNMCGLQDCTLQQQNGSSLIVDDDICFSTLQNFPQHQTQFLLNHEIHNFGFDSNQGICSVSNCNNCSHNSFSQALNAQLEFQRQELQCFLQLQVYYLIYFFFTTFMINFSWNFNGYVCFH